MAKQQGKKTAGSAGAQVGHPSEVLRLVAGNYPGASLDDLRKIFRDEMERPVRWRARHAEHDLYFGSNIRRYVARAASAPLRTGSATTEDLRRKVALVFLNWSLENGMTLGNCTKEDLVNRSGWLRALASKMKPGERVIDVYTDEDIMKVYNKHCISRT